MSQTIEIDYEAIYGAWRRYLLEHSKARHFGTLFDPSKKAEFPYANLSLVSHPTNGRDLEANEMSVDLTFDTEAYINTKEYLTLMNIDNANAEFFIGLGFRRIGNSQITRVSNTVSRIMSRFTLWNYTGSFLHELSDTDAETSTTTNG